MRDPETELLALCEEGSGSSRGPLAKASCRPNHPDTSSMTQRPAQRLRYLSAESQLAVVDFLRVSTRKDTTPHEAAAAWQKWIVPSRCRKFTWTTIDLTARTLRN
jgi:hypothetical protein